MASMRTAALAALAIALCFADDGVVGSIQREYVHALHYTQDGGVEARVDARVTYRLRVLWRLDEGGAWRLVDEAGYPSRALPLEPSRMARPLGLVEGFYFAVADVAGHTECDPFSVSLQQCTDVMLQWPWPRGEIAVCLPGGRASFVPDPLELMLPDGQGARAACGHNGYVSAERTLERSIPNGPTFHYYADGRIKWRGTHRDGELEGPAKGYDVDGRTIWSGTYRGGKLHGLVTELHEAYRLETPYVAGKRHGTQRGLDLAGRLTSKGEFVNDEPSSYETYHPNGAVASRVTQGILGQELHYDLAGVKTSEWRTVLTGGGAAHQCIAVFDEDGRSQPCLRVAPAPSRPDLSP
jgi:hypothetical protein